ncbi:FecR family protein [Steroidobacter sp.]|uniref:FecR family protein n=1 Tax=Steroidobacter sp. TaxID=1978227 RepID=UPI0025DAF7B0|nr:FecR domain-containing protein [Steroidobacter sp.]
MARVQQEEQMTLREQAAWWLTEMQEATPEIEQQFSQWLRESPRHVEEYLFVEALWGELDGIDRQHSVDVQQLIASAGGVEAIAKVTPFGRVSRLLRAPWPATGSKSKRSAAVAAVVAGVVVSALASWIWWPTQETYATTVGEQRAVKLEDGSFIYLNTQSRVEVDYSEHERRVRLLSGEALFTVHHDASRPFRVYSADTVVQAVGTQFNVYRHDDRTTVSVVEGIVAVTDERPGKTVVVAAAGETTLDSPGAGPLRITAGEQANVSPAGHIEKRPQGDIEKAVAWRARRLVFRSESLADVAEQFNRYNTIKIRVEGEAVRNRKLIGTFNADDPTSLVKFLAGEADLRAQEIGGELVITPR